MHTEFKELNSIVPAVQQYKTQHIATHKGLTKYRKQMLEIQKYGTFYILVNVNISLYDFFLLVLLFSNKA